MAKYIFKFGLIATCLVVSAIFSSPAGAAVEITGAGIYSANQVTISGGTTGFATPQTEDAGAIDLSLSGGGNVWVFSVDLYHDITVNIGSQLPYSPPLVYLTSTLTKDSHGPTSGNSGNPVPTLTSEEIGYLAAQGIEAARSSAPNLWSPAAIDTMTAAQGAIWALEYGTIETAIDPATQAVITAYNPAVVTSSNPSIQAMINADIVGAPSHLLLSAAPTLYPIGLNGQGFGTSEGFVTGVPEPTVWLMLLLGFFGTGVMVRRSGRKDSLTGF